MRRFIVIFLLVMLCLFVHESIAESIYIENHSFEEPGTFKTHGWDEADGAYFIDDNNNNIGPAEVPGWESEGEVIDSGVSYTGDQIAVEHGDWYGYLMGDDPTVWQLTDYTIALGDVFTLTFDAYDVWDGEAVTAILYYQDGLKREPLGSMTLSSGLNKYSPTVGTFEAAANTASVGKKLGIEFDNPLIDDDFQYGTWVGFDKIEIEVGYNKRARNPYPENNAVEIDALSGSITLTWDSGMDLELSEPGNPVVRDDVVSYTLYFGTDPNIPDNPSKSVTVVDQSGSSTESIEFDSKYYWRVDQVLEDSSVIEGFPWTFDTITAWPVVSAGPSIITWVDIAKEGIQLDATITDATGDQNDPLWSLITPTGNVSEGVVISDTTIEDPVIALDRKGIYILKLFVDDDEGHQSEDMLEIKVYSDACDAAKHSSAGYTSLEYDFDSDCIINIQDFTYLASEWLMVNNLEGYDSYDKDVDINLLINPGFETGDKTGWDIWEYEGIEGPIFIPVVITGEQRSGMYCARVQDSPEGWGDGFAQWFYPEPGATYTLSFWYKGDLKNSAEGWWGLYTEDKTTYTAVAGELTEFGDEYVEVTATFTIPENYNSGDLQLWTWVMPGVFGTAYFDDFSLTEVFD